VTRHEEAIYKKVFLFIVWSDMWSVRFIDGVEVGVGFQLSNSGTKLQRGF
jgi:hypothetical protein